MWWILPQWTVFLFFHFIYFSLYRFDLFSCLVELF
jgi:hypothetical protein